METASISTMTDETPAGGLYLETLEMLAEVRRLPDSHYESVTEPL
jgi:hypothetical protein